MKTRSQIIIDLINNKISITQAMDTLKILLNDIDNPEIKNWLLKEIDGYNPDDDIPKYRIVPATITGEYLASYGRIHAKQHPIPIDPQYIADWNSVKIFAGINEIYQFSLAEQKEDSHHLSISLHPVLVDQIAMIDGEVLEAHQDLSIYTYTNIIGKLKEIILDILLELEKEYGNLDSYYIEFENDEKEKQTINYIISIIDNSIKFGDKNIIKNSNIGDENEN